MNYEKIYNALIEKAKTSPCVEGQYVEKHHIIPKSLGGSNDSSNLVKLTARQHYIGISKKDARSLAWHMN